MQETKALISAMTGEARGGSRAGTGGPLLRLSPAVASLELICLLLTYFHNVPKSTKFTPLVLPPLPSGSPSQSHYLQHVLVEEKQVHRGMVD